MRHYFTQLAARPLVFSGRTFRFLICAQNAGRAVGVYATEDAAEINVLDAAVAARRGIKAIEVDEYEGLKKKATIALQSVKSGGSRPKLARPPELAMEKAGVVGAASGKNNDEEGMLTRPPAEKLIRLQKVASPKPFSGSEIKTKRASERASAAKIRVARPSVDAGPNT